MVANDRKPGFPGNRRFPEDKEDIKTVGGDPLDETTRDDANEGEGNKSADRRYREGVANTVKSGKVEKKAREAETALSGKEGEALRRAEELGRMRSHGEDPALKKK
jgi:hypothetical protein